MFCAKLIHPYMLDHFLFRFCPCRLSKLISQRWQHLSEKGKNFYTHIALMDCQRYYETLAQLHELSNPTEDSTEEMVYDHNK